MPESPIARWAASTAREAAWAPSVVFLAHVVAHVVFDVYGLWSWFDLPMHFLGGVVIAYFFHRASINASRFALIGPHHPATHAVLVQALVFSATVVWEFAEFAYDRAFGTRHQVSLDDTMLDMFLGVVGGATYLIVRGAADARSAKDAAPPPS